MKTKETSKLRRYKILFVISVIGFAVIVSYFYFKLDLPHTAYTILGPVLGMITGASLLGFITFGILALEESSKEEGKETLKLKMYKLVSKIFLLIGILFVVVGSFIKWVLDKEKLGITMGYIAIVFFVIWFILFVGISYKENS